MRDSAAGLTENDLLQPGAPASPPTSGTRFQRWSAACFPLLLWFLAAYFFWGRLGKWLDDYWLSVRDPVTGAYEFPVWSWTQWPFFYRPFHLTFVQSAQTLLWNHDGLLHLLSALVHGAATLLLWRVLRDVTRTAHAAAAGAMLFLTFPLSYENILWPAAISTGIATATFLAMLLAYLRMIRDGWTRRDVILMTLLAFTIPCWNEQPATGIAALPLLYWSMYKSRLPWKQHLAQAFIPALACSLACLIYLLLVHATVPPTIRGGSGSLASVSRLGSRFAAVSHEVHLKLFGAWIAHIVRGGLAQGLQVMTLPRSLPWLCALSIAGIAWWRHWCARPLAPRPHGCPRGRRQWATTVLFGLALFALGWMPLVMIRGQIVEPRMCYYPTVGLVFAGAAVLDWLGATLAASRITAFLFKRGVAVAVLGTSLVGAVTLVGTQKRLREQYDLDQSTMRELTQLVPTPPPGTVFMPLRVEPTANTGFSYFDRFAHCALAQPWSARAIVRQTYRRNDLFSTPCSWWGPPPLRDADASGVRCDVVFRPRREAHHGTNERILWSQTIPFVLEAGGHVRLISTVTLTPSDEDAVNVDFPYVRTLLDAHGLPEQTCTLQGRGTQSP